MPSARPVARTAVRRSGLAAALLALLASAAPALADPVWLVGAQVYSANEDGSNRAGPFQYSTNASTQHYDLLVSDSHGHSAASAIAFQLSEGDNPLTFAFQSASLTTPIVGLNLFFSSTAASYNPTYTAGVGIPGNLTAFSVAGFSGFGAPTQGTRVQSFNADGLSTNDTPYSGATVYQVGNESISVTAFSATSAPSGSFTLSMRPAATNPVAVPEPATVALLGLGVAGLALSRRRRRA